MGCAAGFSSSKWEQNNSYSDKLAIEYSFTRFNIIPTVRFDWLNKPIEQLYSSVGIGLFFISEENKNHEIRSREYNYNHVRCTAAFDFTFIGITVGKQLYGLADIAASNGELGNILF